MAQVGYLGVVQVEPANIGVAPLSTSTEAVVPLVWGDDDEHQMMGGGKPSPMGL